MWSHSHRRTSSGVLRWAIAALVAGISATASAQTAEDCLQCHADDSLTAKRGDVEISAFVDGAKLAAGAHGGLACFDCHADLAGQGDGHGDDAAPVDCASCHEIL